MRCDARLSCRWPALQRHVLRCARTRCDELRLPVASTRIGWGRPSWRCISTAGPRSGRSASPAQAASRPVCEDALRSAAFRALDDGPRRGVLDGLNGGPSLALQLRLQRLPAGPAAIAASGTINPRIEMRARRSVLRMPSASFLGALPRPSGARATSPGGFSEESPTGGCAQGSEPALLGASPPGRVAAAARRPVLVGGWANAGFTPASRLASRVPLRSCFRPGTRMGFPVGRRAPQIASRRAALPVSPEGEGWDGLVARGGIRGTCLELADVATACVDGGSGPMTRRPKVGRSRARQLRRFRFSKSRG
jgi:hypothetical protein